jgi:hypothetical protein
MPSIDLEHTFRYVDCDVPAGMTLSSWRDEKARAERRSRRSGLLRRRGR